MPNVDQKYAQLVLQKHQAGEINALQAYTDLASMTNFPDREAMESEEGYILRVAVLDYDDAPYQGALFQSLADQVGY